MLQVDVATWEARRRVSTRGWRTTCIMAGAKLSPATGTSHAALAAASASRSSIPDTNSSTRLGSTKPSGLSRSRLARAKARNMPPPSRPGPAKLLTRTSAFFTSWKELDSTSAWSTVTLSDSPFASTACLATSAMAADPSTAITCSAPAWAHIIARCPGPQPTSRTTLPRMWSGLNCSSASCQVRVSTESRSKGMCELGLSYCLK
mmetsp:Transcript_9417/g.25406  ORF Transcript_9417/g.25406 Transcript_9417/m.25406 type:complete len:205 (+) Transcript_9417:697-1311(+)